MELVMVMFCSCHMCEGTCVLQKNSRTKASIIVWSFEQSSHKKVLLFAKSDSSQSVHKKNELSQLNSFCRSTKEFNNLNIFKYCWYLPSIFENKKFSSSSQM
mmetsp:Transcript_22797/g.52251  ORF Transcript_22797/g.52251 Transcript_22797/m.52251 type:complete len:102 (+) Transcript_22797:1240-1545(+)